MRPYPGTTLPNAAQPGGTRYSAKSQGSMVGFPSSFFLSVIQNVPFRLMYELAIDWHMETQQSIHTKPPLPPFTHETAELKVRLAEDAWNSRDPARVALAYTPSSQWRNRSEFVNGR